MSSWDSSSSGSNSGSVQVSQKQLDQMINPGFDPASLAGPGIGAVGSVLGAYMTMKQQQEQFDDEMDFRERQFSQQKKVQDSQLATSTRTQNLANASSAVQLNNYIMDRGVQQAGLASMLRGLAGAK